MPYATNRTRSSPGVLYGRGKKSIYRLEAPHRSGGAARVATPADSVSPSLKERAEADGSRVLKRGCCAKIRLGRHDAALFIGDSQLEALYDHVCERKTKRCNSATSTRITMVVAAGKWARYYPSFHTAQVALAQLPRQGPAPTLVVSNMASPHLLHVHPVRPLLDVETTARAAGCYPQSTCADYRGLINLEGWLAADVAEFRQRLRSPRLILMAPNWVCNEKLYGTYLRKLNLPVEARTKPCLDWIQQRPKHGSHPVTEQQVCEDFTFSASGTDATSLRMEAAARSHNAGWLPATDLTRGRCNATSDSRHYPALVPSQLQALVRLL